MSASPTQLYNPKAVWFLGAPVSKAIALLAVVTFIVAEMNKLHQALVFGESNYVAALFHPISFMSLQYPQLFFTHKTLILFGEFTQQIRQKYLTMHNSIVSLYAI